MSLRSHLSSYFPFTDTAPSEIYTLSLHDALPISGRRLDAISCAQGPLQPPLPRVQAVGPRPDPVAEHARLHLARRGVVAYADRKSTRLNSSHGYISYAVFCLKKKKKTVLKFFVML